MRAKPGRGIVVYFISIIAIFLCAGAGFAATIYVDDDATGANNGSSWQNAYKYLQDALAASNVNTEIRVAQGVYRPDQTTLNPTGTGNRSASFTLKSGIKLLGGYAGVNQANPDERDISRYRTILSGDLAGNDDDLFSRTSDNSYSVVQLNGSEQVTTVEGMSISGGYNESSPNLGSGGMRISGGRISLKGCIFFRNASVYTGGALSIGSGQGEITSCHFENNRTLTQQGGAASFTSCSISVKNSDFIYNRSAGWGGALYVYGSGTMSFVQCKFLNNTADHLGGAIYIGTSSPQFAQCLFGHNHSSRGGAILSWGFGSFINRPIFQFCTFAGNDANICGGISNEISLSELSNCILWGNSASGISNESDQIAWGNDQPTVKYSCVQGWTGVLGGVGNFGLDPRFVNPDGDDWHLLPGSPCIDAGDPAADFSNEPLPNGGRVDIGAYGNTPETTITTDDDNDGAGTSSEIRWGLDPYNPDTDKDGLKDGFEAGYDGNAAVYDPYNPITGRGTDLNAAVADTDGDGISDFDEINLYGTNPINPDSDGDGLKDGDELSTYLTNPKNPDSDRDTMPDGWEITHGLNPLVDDSKGDLDGDGIDNITEFRLGTKPDNTDSDGDGMPDGWEVAHGLNPAIDDRDLDLDGDGYTNLAEYRWHSLPDDPQSIPHGFDLYVDDNAPNDPGPGNPTISDPLEDGTAEHPFDSIQKAIDAAKNGMIIGVADGEYTGTGNNGFNFKGKGIAVRGANGARNCVINLQQAATGILFISGETSSAVLDGLTVMGHYGHSFQYDRASIHIENSSPRISNCVFTDNRYDAIYIKVGSPTIEHCEFTDNSGGVYGDPMTGVVRDCVFYHNLGMGIYLTNQSKGRIENCLLYENGTYYESWAITVYSSDATISHCTIAMQGSSYHGVSEGMGTGISITNSGDIPHTVGIDQTIVWGCQKPIAFLDNTKNVTVSVRYSDIEGGYAGEGNIDTNPGFVRMGRWDPMGTPDYLYDDEWIQGDYHLSQDSPCVNAGDPLFAGGAIEDIDGQVRVAYGRVDIGADEYVGTDFDGDGKTTLTDFGTFAEQWMRQACGVCGWADYRGDNAVDLDDLAVFIPEWLRMPVPEGMPRPILYCPFDGTTQNIASPFQFESFWKPAFVGSDEARVGSGAIVLNGIGPRVVIDFPSITGGWPRTVTAWIKTAATEGDLIYWGSTTKASGLWKVCVAGGKLKVDINGASAQGNTLVNTGQWVHVAAVFPPRTFVGRVEDIRLYVNGIGEATTATPLKGVNTDTGGTALGKFSGLLDDLRIYDCELDLSELAQVTGLFCIDAGSRQNVDLRFGNRVSLNGQIFNSSGTPDVQWEQISGPEMVSIANPGALSPSVELNREGEYVFRMTVRDGEQVMKDTVAIGANRGEVGYWTFDGYFCDQAGNLSIPNGNPTFVGADQSKEGTGAIEFHGADYVLSPLFGGIPGTKARTCMAWIKTTGTSGPIVYWGDKNTAGRMWDLRVNSSGQLRAQMNGCGVNGVSAVNTGQWVHVAAVLPEGGNNADDVLLYVNGVLETGGAVTAGTINTGVLAAMRIGANEAGNYFTGLIDDVRVYDRALTTGEIAATAGQ